LASEANGREKEVEHPGIAAIFPRPHRASSSAKLLRGTTTKVEWGGEKKMKKQIGNLQNLLQNWQQKKKKRKQKREEDTRIRRFVARKKEQMQMESQKRPPKRSKSRTPRLAEVWLKEFIHLSLPHG
jgi:hypothetical protein